MVKANIYDQKGQAIGERELPEKVFGVPVRPELVHEVLVSIEASARQPLAHTKTRGEVRGGGKKPWRQKGTGRARHGSTRSPIWVGGGITFGPRKERDYGRKVNRKMKQLAFVMSLSDKAAEGRIALVESFGIRDGKTKETVGLVGNLPVQGKALVLTAGRDEMLARSARNLRLVRYAGVGDVSLKQVLDADWLVTTPEAIDRLSAVYGPKEK
ncbi:50S ribosomal protein L4 [Candidatus Uhrbacteria bacterium]|nr:50S ribosomal protein L4 [Candidatus Uhrbacteria bacterium]